MMPGTATPANPKPAKPLRRAAVQRMLKADKALGVAERACAVLLADRVGMDGADALAGLTPSQLADLAGSVRARVERNERRVWCKKRAGAALADKQRKLDERKGVAQ